MTVGGIANSFVQIKLYVAACQLIWYKFVRNTNLLEQNQ
jgi:hypothetical protein